MVRQDVLASILALEEKYSVNDLKLNTDVDLWPYLKIQLVMVWLEKKPQNEVKKSKASKYSILQSIFSSVLKVPRGLYLLSKLKKEELDYLFIGSNSHHIEINGKSENRYYYPILKTLSLDNKKRKWEEFIQTHPASWEQTYAADTPFDKKFRKTFGSMPNLPQLFIIKRDGKAYRVKYLSQLKAELQKILEEEQ